MLYYMVVEKKKIKKVCCPPFSMKTLLCEIHGKLDSRELGLVPLFLCGASTVKFKYRSIPGANVASLVPYRATQLSNTG